MKFHLFFLTLAMILTAKIHAQTNSMQSIYEIPIKDIDGKPTTLADYKGKVFLIVNVASRCGFTSQYSGLEQLQQKFKDKGFSVLGFPCNDYGAQEPGSNEEIKTFCSSKYNVTFPLFDKLHTKGAEQHQLYQLLTAQASPSGGVAWNFEKFLVAKDGAIVGCFKSAVKPDDPTLVAAIEKELAK